MEKPKPKQPQQNPKKRFVIDKSRTPQIHAMVTKFLEDANRKELGRAITFADLTGYALAKLTATDLDELRAESLSDMDKIQLELAKYNDDNDSNLSLGQFLVKRLEL